MPRVLAAMRSRLLAVAERRLPALTRLRLPEPVPLTLHRRRIYVLPTAFGLGFAVLLLVMLLGALNYGNNPALRAGLRQRGVGYVLAVSCDHRIPTNGGPVRADSVARGLPPGCWQRLSAGVGSKGHRMYSWAYLQLPAVEGGSEWILMRRNDSTAELAFYRCFQTGPVPLRELVRVAGRRWTIEESFQAAKGQAGLDEHQVRTWISWHRWTVLCMLAMAFLAVITRAERDRSTTPDGLIPYTLNEIRRLFDALTVGPAPRSHDHILSWSHWRRRHQAIARAFHYRRRSQHQ